jgi:hypothetical protein
MSDGERVRRSSAGRPTDRDRVIAKAKELVRSTQAESLSAFGREVRGWLSSLPDAIRTAKRAEVMSVRKIEDYVRPIWRRRREKER